MVGQPLTFHALAMGPLVLPPSHQERQVMFSFFMTSRSRSLGSELMPSSANGLFSSLFTSDRSCGYMARQGPHQSPQKSSTTTFPRYSLSLNVLPSTSSPWISGATLPIDRLR